jgi:hypothetical protein
MSLYQTISILQLDSGNTMTNTDMIWFSAQGSKSVVLDLYSFKRGLPSTDAL